MQDDPPEDDVKRYLKKQRELTERYSQHNAERSIRNANQPPSYDGSEECIDFDCNPDHSQAAFLPDDDNAVLDNAPMQDERLPPVLETRILGMSGAFAMLLYLFVGANFVEKYIGETTLGLHTWDYAHYVLAILAAVIFAGATKCLCVFYEKQLNNTSDDPPAPRRRIRVKHDTEHKGSEFGGLIIVVVFLAFLILFGTAQLFIWFPWLWPM